MLFCAAEHLSPVWSDRQLVVSRSQSFRLAGEGLGTLAASDLSDPSLAKSRIHAKYAVILRVVGMNCPCDLVRVGGALLERVKTQML